MREVFVGQFGSRVTGHWVGFQVWKKVKNYKDWPYDLIASLLGKSNDAVRLNVYQRILELNNNNPSIPWEDWDKLMANSPLKQSISTKGKDKYRDCGASANRFGATYFGQKHFISGDNPYYKPLRDASANISDLKFDPAKMNRGLNKICNIICNQTAVNVFATHSDGMTVANGKVQRARRIF